MTEVQSASKRWRASVLIALQAILLRLRSWLFSFCVHAMLLIVLGLILIPTQPGTRELLLNWGKPGEHAELEEGFESVVLAPAVSTPALQEAAREIPEDILQPDANVVPDVSLAMADVADAMASAPSAQLAESVDGLALSELSGALGGLDGRAGRRGNARALGATAESEAAVDLALTWLAAHQLSDGSWNFDLHQGRCGGKCANSGYGAQAVRGATGLALLPFLGAGQTHEVGNHRATVTRGLLYLIKNQQDDGAFIEPEGTMYSHGICALALCEAVAMSKAKGGASDRRLGIAPSALRRTAQRSLSYIADIQHEAGGWRYMPGQPGDTSVVAWQSMALRSGKMAGLNVPPRTLAGIDRFLDSVQVDEYGAKYGYMPGNRPREGTTAAGLLCRLYSGWSRGNPAIVNGAEQLDEWGPSSNNVYYNYYATQVMHHYQGPLWEKWNRVLRDFLVSEQVPDGHEAGSWYFDDDFGSNLGGRLYITAMTAMTLEVYYRHMPIYSPEAVARTKP